MRLAARTCLVASLALAAALPGAAQSPITRVRLLPADALASSLTWRPLASDGKGDVRQQRLPDARELAYALDPKADRVWFKVAVHEPLHERWFGVNVAADIDDAPDSGMAWWGGNKIKFDRLVSAYVSGYGGDWQGYVGVSDSESVGRGNMSGLTRAVDVAVDRERRTVLLGVPRSALGTAPTIRVIATVGSMLAYNDDVPNEGMVTVSLRP